MKLVLSLLLIMALGLSTAYSQDYTDPETDEEIEEFDATINRIRMLKEMAQLLADNLEHHPQKRFFSNLLKKIEKKFKEITHDAQKLYEKAKKQFEKQTKDIDFKEVVNRVAPKLTKGAGKVACKKMLLAGARAFLGPAAPVVSVVAGPVCSAAIAQLEKEVKKH